MADLIPGVPLARRLLRHRHLALPLGWLLLGAASLALLFPAYQWYQGIYWLHLTGQPKPFQVSGYFGSFPLAMREGATISLTTIACCILCAAFAEGARRQLAGTPRILAMTLFVVACVFGSLTLFTGM